MSSNNDSTSEIIFVKSEKVEDSLVKRKTAAAPTLQGKKVKKIYIEPCVSYLNYIVFHLPRNLLPKRFIPTCHHCEKVGHIWPNCFKLKLHVHKNKNSHSRKEPLGLCRMMMGGLTRLDKFENIHVFTPSFRKVWVRKDYTIQPLRGSGNDLTLI